MNKFKKLLISALACCSFGLAAMASVASTNNEPVQTHAEVNETTLWEGADSQVSVYQADLPEDKPELFFVELDGSNDILYMYDADFNEIKRLPSSSHFEITFTDQEWSSIYDGGRLIVTTERGTSITKISYVSNAKETIKLSELMANYPDFPTTQETGWSNGTCRMWYEATTGGFSTLRVSRDSYDPLVIMISRTALTECEGGYEYSLTSQIIKFNITDNVLTSIFFDDYSESDWCGLYEPVAPKMTIGEVLNTVPGGFPTSLNDFIPGDAWRNQK